MSNDIRCTKSGGGGSGQCLKELGIEVVHLPLNIVGLSLFTISRNSAIKINIENVV